eukprot:sb/3465457/
MTPASTAQFLSPILFIIFNRGPLTKYKRALYCDHNTCHLPGPLTKYKRALYCDEYVHEIFSSGEVAERLAQIILPLFDPSFPTPAPVETYEIPKMVKPKVVFAVLPGGYQYLHVGRPQPLVDLETAMLDSNYGRELVTGDKDTGYFRLHLNQYHSVETITCLSKDPFEVSNITQIYGLHQQFMNSLEDRFDSGLISDFFSYFREPWSLLLYHDRFPELRAEIMELLGQPNQPALVCQMIDEDLTVEEKTKIALAEEYAGSLAKTAVENRLFSYLSYNKAYRLKRSKESNSRPKYRSYCDYIITRMPVVVLQPLPQPVYMYPVLSLFVSRCRENVEVGSGGAQLCRESLSTGYVDRKALAIMAAPAVDPKTPQEHATYHPITCTCSIHTLAHPP